MLFSAPLFLFVFLPLVLITSMIVPRALRNAVLLLASLFFYAWGEPIIVFFVLASATIDYVLARIIAQGGTGSYPYLTAGIAGNLSLLFVFKYADFVLRTVEPMTGTLPHLNLVLPLGISFVVFEKVTYLVDIHRGTCKPAASFYNYLLFVFFFPKMLSGPIIKYHEIEQALYKRQETWDDRTAGILRFLWGLSRKVLIADVCGEVADTIFARQPGTLGFSAAWLGVIAFTVQIYFDFAGYSDMAIGLARMFGFRLRENFDNPYASSSFTEFWRRWHISLSSWVREYLYFPLGGNRRGPTRTYINLWTCFLLSGLWHGAAWTFVLWGAWNGFFLVLDRLFWERLTSKLPSFASIAITLLLIIVGWVIFRANSIAQLGEFLKAMFTPKSEGEFVYIQAHQTAAIVLGLVGSFIAAIMPFSRLIEKASNNPVGWSVGAIGITMLGAVSLAKTVVVAFQPFLYFRF